MHWLLNSLHPKIRFTIKYRTEKLPFLNILLCKKENKLYGYYKTTDTHPYLDYRSCHPKHTKNNIPYTLVRRICTIIVEENLKEKRLQERIIFLRKQNYPEGLIHKGIEKARKIDITQLRSPKEEKHDHKILPIVITNNPNNLQIIGKVKEYYNFLRSSRKMRAIMDETKLVVSRRQPKNLKQHLTKARFSSTSSKATTVTKSNEPRCGTCNLIITGESITFKNGKTWRIMSDMSCQSRNITYTIISLKCESFYIGQTGNLRNRVKVYKEQIKHKKYRHLQVNEHLSSCNGGIFKICPTYNCYNGTRLSRESKEKEIISILKPDLNT